MRSRTIYGHARAPTRPRGCLRRSLLSHRGSDRSVSDDMVGLARARTRPGSAQGDGRAQGRGHAPAGGERDPPGAPISLYACITIRVCHRTRIVMYGLELAGFRYPTHTQRRAYTPACRRAWSQPPPRRAFLGHKTQKKTRG